MRNETADFLEKLKEKGYSEKTIRLYRGIVTSLEKRGPLTQERLRTYEKKIRVLRLSTRRTYLSTLKNYLKKTGNRLEKEVVIPKEKKRLPEKIPTQREVREIVAKPDIFTFMGIRDRALLEVLYGTGIRNSEARHLKLEDIEWTKRVLRIEKGKGGKDRVVPIGKTACEWLKAYLERVRPVTKTIEREVFVSLRGKRLSVQAIYQTVKRYGEYSPHKYRHACATHVMENGMKVGSVQKLLGHARLSTTQVYTRVTIHDLQDMYRRYHPRDGWKL